MTEQSFSNVGTSKALALIRRGLSSHGFAKYPHLYIGTKRRSWYVCRGDARAPRRQRPVDLHGRVTIFIINTKNYTCI